MKEERIEIGKITSPHGIRGEVKAYMYTENPERFEAGKTLYIAEKSYEIESSRVQAPFAFLKLKGIEDRNAAELLIKKIVFIKAEELSELPEGSYYVRDIIGITVNDKKRGRIGIVSDVIQGSSQDLYELKLNDGRKLLIPAVEEFVKEISLKKAEIEVELPPEYDELKYS